MKNTDDAGKKRGLLGVDTVTLTFGLTYLSFATGNYGDQKYPGLTLQFSNPTGLKNYHAIFNAELTRARNTRTGNANAPLPKNHFRMKERSEFVKFWRKTDLKVPPRLSVFHDRMGNLKTITFTGTAALDGRLDCKSIQPLNITSTEILQAIKTGSRADNIQTSAGHAPHNLQTKTPDKKQLQNQDQHGLSADQTTGALKRETSQQEETCIREGSELPTEKQVLKDCSTTQWLKDCERTFSQK